MKVAFWTPGESYKKIKKAVSRKMDEILSHGDLILREDVEKFEKTLAKFVGTEYAVSLNSGTDALVLSLKFAEVGEGDEVITVSNTFKATITAINAVWAIPVLVDIGEDWLMDIDEVKKKITPRTKAIIPVHLSGDMVDLPKLAKLLKDIGREDIKIIEDACQALGAEIGGKKAGSFGLTGCFSFYPAKILGSYGDGGAVTTDDPLIYRAIKNWRNHCKDEPGFDGCNSRLDNLQAGVLNVKFKHLEEYLEKREKIAHYYLQEFAGLPIDLPVKRLGRVWQDFIIRYEKRELLARHLKQSEIQIMLTPELPHIELKMNVSLPKTEKYNNEFIRIPCNPDMTREQMKYVARRVKEFFV